MATYTPGQKIETLASPFAGALFGALAIGVVTALVVGVAGVTGNIRSGGAPASEAAPAATAMPTDMPGMNMGTGTQTTPVKLAPAKAVTAPTIARSASDVAAPITRSTPALVRVDLETKQVTAEIEKGETYTYWTFNGTVPGPMIRVRVGDTVELHL